MIRNSLSVCALAMVSMLSACGGGGGGGGGDGGGGSTDVGIDNPATISNSNFGEIAGLAVRSNLIVADNPNYNEGYPASIVGAEPRVMVNAVDLSRMQLVEISKVKPNEIITAELPAGIVPVDAKTDCGAAGDGTKTRTYLDDDRELSTRKVGDKLTIVYTGCKLELAQEASNCVLVTETAANKKFTLNGTVETEVTATNASGYTTKLVYTNLIVAGTAGTSTINGNLSLEVSDGSSKVLTLKTLDAAGLTSKTGDTLERLRNATIKYSDNQEGCTNPAPNNAYVIFKDVTVGEVASNKLGYVNVSVSSDLVGNSATNGGFPNSGAFVVQGQGDNRMIITADPTTGKANIKFNVGTIPCTTPQPWDHIFQGLPGGCLN